MLGGTIPQNGFVPDSATAVAIAEAVLIRIYGEKQVASERPFIATLDGDLWTVTGTLHCPNSPRCNGGTAVATISKTDGRIGDVCHGK